MSKYAIESTTLTAIGDAIREKTGTEDLIPVPQLANKILEISGGGSGGEVSVNNGVIKSAKAYLGDIKAGDLCSYSALYPRYYQKNYNSAIPFMADYYFSGGGHYANYNYSELREIIPLKDKHWLWSYVLSSTKYYVIGYFDNNDDYINVAESSESISSTYNSMILGVFDDGATIVEGNGTPNDVKISVKKLNTATHKLDTIGTISSALSQHTLNNTKCIELSSGKYLVMQCQYGGSSYDDFSYTILTNYNDTVSSVKDASIRIYPPNHSEYQYLIDVELLSNGNIRVVTNYYIADFSIANNTLSSVASYRFNDSGDAVKYDEDMYIMGSAPTYLYKIDTDTNKMTELDHKYLSNDGGQEEGFSTGYHNVFVTEDKKIVCVSARSSDQPLINVAKVENNKIIFGTTFAVPGQNSLGTSSKLSYSYLGQMDGTNVFYLVYGSSSTTVVIFFMIDENGHVIFIDSDETARCFSSTSTNQSSSTRMKSFTGYLFNSVSHNRTHISKLYKDGVFMMILPNTNSTSSTSSYDYQIIYKFDKDILMRGISNFGVPALAIEDINNGAVGQAYVAK